MQGCSLSIDCGGRKVEITWVSITGGWAVKCGECTHGGLKAALEDLENTVLDKI